nr:hypothetical protein [Tanacetum cinerariifolium]
MPKVLSLAWETILKIDLAFEDKHCQPKNILEVFQRLFNDVQNIHEELAVYINTLSWDRPTICYDDDDDEDCTIAITPILSTEEPDNSLSMGDEHLDTVLVTKSDEFIKSSVENLVSIPSESEGIPDNMCDVPFHDNSPPLDVLKDQIEGFSDSNDDSTSINDDSFSIDNIEYVEASPPDSELVSLEMMEIVIPEVGGIDDDILLIIKDDILQTNTFDNSLPESKTFCFDLEEISNGSTTTHSDSSLYDSFIFDLSINQFPPADRSDFYEFTDELAHIISLPDFDSVPYISKPNFVDESTKIFNPPPQPPIYSCEFCGSNAQYGHHYTPQAQFNNPEQGYSPDFNFLIPINLKTRAGFCHPVFISSASLGNHVSKSNRANVYLMAYLINGLRFT